jgi:hypothetical protein
MERDAADRSRYQLGIDQDNSTPINFAESINFFAVLKDPHPSPMLLSHP